MIIRCYACHQPASYTGWNPFRQVVVCSCCGRHNYIGEALERMHGDVIGRRVKSILRSLSDVGDRGRESLAHLAHFAVRRIENLLKEVQ